MEKAPLSLGRKLYRKEGPKAFTEQISQNYGSSNKNINL